jgi:AbiV family abortive infection protein
MENLTIEELHSLRLAIFENAENLQKEASLLFNNQMFSRAYLLAYFCCEELGKIPIIVGAIAKLQSNENIDWKKLKKRFYNHTKKISSQNHHYYVFGMKIDLQNNSDVKWLETAENLVQSSFEKKNLATYVDVKNKKILHPLKEINKNETEKLISFAFQCLKAHWHSELLTNPILKKDANKTE